MAELDQMASELRRANQQVTRELEERARAEHAFRTIFEASPVGIALTDLEGRHLDVNPAFEQQCGIERSQIIGTRGPDMTVEELPGGPKPSLGGSPAEAREIAYAGPESARRTALLWS